MRRGFTLVELSIVLVIIGLLIGGILVAQSMIQTAKIQGLVRQFGQFDAAVDNFQTKFGQLPGDTNLMGLSPGNNDGLITDTYGNSQGGPVYFQGEDAKFWSDLSNSGFTKPGSGSYLDGSSITSPPTLNYVPQAQTGLNATVIPAGDPGSKFNYYLFAAFNQSSFVLSNAPKGAYYAAEMLSIDSKMDDGLANSGNMSDINLPYFYEGLNYQGNCTNNSKYVVTDTTDLCAFKIRMGTSTSDLK